MDIEGLIPMTFLFNLGEIGELRIEDLLFGLPDVHVPTMVKPEFVSIVIKRGGARLSELKHEIRSKLEPALIGLKEDTNRPQ